METETALKLAQTLLAPLSLSSSQPESNRLDFIVPADQLKKAVQYMLEAHWGYYAAITGLDFPKTEASEGKIEVLYHFFWGHAGVTLRVSLPYSNAVVPSICDLIPSATLSERELSEMFGVTVVDTPNTSRLLLPDDWPDGVYPLRKEFTGFKNPAEVFVKGDK